MYNKDGHAVMDCCHSFDEYFKPTDSESRTQASTSTNTCNTQEGGKSQDTSTTPATAYLAHQDQL